MINKQPESAVSHGATVDGWKRYIPSRNNDSSSMREVGTMDAACGTSGRLGRQTGIDRDETFQEPWN